MLTTQSWVTDTWTGRTEKWSSCEEPLQTARRIYKAKITHDDLKSMVAETQGKRRKRNGNRSSHWFLEVEKDTESQGTPAFSWVTAG